MAAVGVAAKVAKVTGVTKLLKQFAVSIAVLFVGGAVFISAAFGVFMATVFGAVQASAQEPGGVLLGCSFELEGGGDVVLPLEGGGTMTLTDAQVQTAAGLFAGAVAVGATSEELERVLGAAMQESWLRVYANELVPESLGLPHDVVGTPLTDSGVAVDTLGPLQQTPSNGWGNTAELMDPQYAAQAFLGGPDGPNGGSPGGLRDVAGWESMSFADSIEAVQISGEPEHYAKWELTAATLRVTFEQLDGLQCGGTASGDAVYPLSDRVPITSDAGPRVAPAPGASSWHPALDFGAGCGTPVLSMRPGKVTSINPGYSNAVTVVSPDGAAVMYLHMWASDIIVSVGDEVAAGQQIGSVGSEPPSTGCHLDLRIDTEGATDPAVQALAVLPAGHGHFVHPEEYANLFGLSLV